MDLELDPEPWIHPGIGTCRIHADEEVPVHIHQVQELGMMDPGGVATQTQSQVESQLVLKPELPTCLNFKGLLRMQYEALLRIRGTFVRIWIHKSGSVFISVRIRILGSGFFLV